MPSGRFHSRLAPWLLLAVGVVALAVSMVTLPEYSQFTAGALNVALLFGALVVFDVLILRRSDTLLEIVEQKNVAYGVYLGLVAVAIAIVIA